MARYNMLMKRTGERPDTVRERYATRTNANQWRGHEENHPGRQPKVSSPTPSEGPQPKRIRIINVVCDQFPRGANIKMIQGTYGMGFIADNEEISHRRDHQRMQGDRRGDDSGKQQ